MLWLIIVLIGLIAGLYYIYRTAVLKKVYVIFVSALIMRNNHWYEKRRQKTTCSFGTAITGSTFNFLARRVRMYPLLQRMMFCYMHGSLISVPKHG